MSTTPFYWKERDGWYLWVRTPSGQRKRVLLAKTKKAAHDKWKAGIVAGTAIYTKDAKFSDVADEWINLQSKRYARGEVSKSWLDRLLYLVKVIVRSRPGVLCSQVDRSFVVSTLPADSSADYERTRIGDLKQILKWAVDEKLIEESPLKNVKLPSGNRREIVLNIEDHRALVSECAVPSMRFLLWCCWWTGSRPSELRGMQWEHLSDDCFRAVLTKHKTARATQKPRVIYFPSVAAAILRRNRKETGFVFINTLGNAWTKDALVGWMKKLRERTGRDGTAYAYRHSYITRALEQGVSGADIAEIAGTSIQMISRNYGHLDKSRDRLQEIARGI